MPTHAASPLTARRMPQEPADRSDQQCVLSPEQHYIVEVSPSRKGTAKSAAWILVNGTIGAGVLGLPFVMRSAGLVLGASLMVFVGIMAWFTLNKLDESARACGVFSYEDVGLIVFGSKWGANAVKLCVIGINFGSMISYQVLAGDFLEPLALQIFTPNGLDRRIIIAIVSFGLMLPLSLPRQISSLQYASLASLLFVVMFVGVVIVTYFTGSPSIIPCGGVVAARATPESFYSLGILTFAYACHTNLLPISAELKDRSGVAMRKAVTGEVIFAISTYLIISVFGYLTFREHTEGDFLLSYDSKTKDVLIDVVRFLLAIVVILTFPLALYPARFSLDNLLFDAGPDELLSLDAEDDVSGENCDAIAADTIVADGMPDMTSENTAEKEAAIRQLAHRHKLVRWLQPQTHRYILLSLCLSVSAFILAVLVPTVEVVFSLTGSTASTFTSWIFPSYFWLKLHPRASRVERGLTWVALIVGGALGMSAFTATVADLFGVFEKGDACDPAALENHHS